MRTNPRLCSSRMYGVILLAVFLALGAAACADNEVSGCKQANIKQETPADTTSNKESAQKGRSEQSAESEARTSSGHKHNKAAADAESKYIRVPLLYMTDRQINRRQQFGNDRKNESNSIYDVFCGSINYTLPNYEKKSLSDSRKALGWNARAKPSKMVHELTNLPEQPSDALDKFGESVLEFARKTGQNEVFVFVHGFNSTFESSARCAALLAYQTERPVILYSWPSTAKVLQYFVDSGNNEWSQEHFNRLVEMLCDLKEKYGLKVNVVAHSMGNRLVVRAAPILENKQLFNQVFLVDPDLDSETFLHYVARYAHKQEIRVGEKIRILFSHKDNVLPVAQMFFGGYTRLGQGADTIVESIFKPYQMLPAVFHGTKTAPGLKKAGASANNEDFVHNLFRKELDWIDFTVLDKGVIGHSIPYKLIANLSQTSEPGSGLAFEPVEVGTSDFKDKVLAHYLGNKKVYNPLGICRKVVFTDVGDSVAAPPLAKNDSKLRSTH